MRYPAPDAVRLEIVTFEFPLFVRVAFNVLLAPTFTFPNERLLGLALTRNVGVAPVPVNEMANGEFGALLTSEIEPIADPAAAGENTTLKVELPPGVIVRGVVKPEMLKPVPVMLV